MYYIYCIFAAVLGSLMLYECHSKGRPKWWALVVFLAPTTTPYYIYKTRKNSGMPLIMIFVTLFGAVAAAEIILYINDVEKNRYVDLPPVTHQMIQLVETLKQSTVRLDNALVKLERLSKVESRIHEIEKTLEFTVKLRQMMKENQNAIHRLTQYTSDHRRIFEKKEISWVLNIHKFYNNRVVIRHYQSLEDYLDNFEELLKYTYVNFYHITEQKTVEHLKNYDEYYIRYRRAVDSHNRFNVQRIEFQNNF